MIDLHYSATPNGQKVAIMLEEVGLRFRVVAYDIFEGDHLTAAFGRINPNHKLPAIVDHAPEDGGEPLAVFESGAILQYLAEKTGRLLPADPRQRSVAIQWLTWQMAGLGPMGWRGSAGDGNAYYGTSREPGVSTAVNMLRSPAGPASTGIAHRSDVS